MSQRALWGAGLFSLAVALGGFVALWDYENRPGDPGAPPVLWPAGASVPLSPDLPTLVVGLHPRCACSVATLSELEELMRRFPGRVAVDVLFYRPEGSDASWARGGLWDQARAIPGVRAWSDRRGDLARRFRVATSGHALLYTPAGRLVFSGGITGARGHLGDNAGVDSIADLLNGTAPRRRETFVFGCLMSGVNLDRGVHHEKS